MKRKKKYLSTYLLPALLTPLPPLPFTTEEINGCTNGTAKGAPKLEEICVLVIFLFHVLFCQ